MAIGGKRREGAQEREAIGIEVCLLDLDRGSNQPKKHCVTFRERDEIRVQRTSRLMGSVLMQHIPRNASPDTDRYGKHPMLESPVLRVEYGIVLAIPVFEYPVAISLITRTQRCLRARGL